MILHIDTTRDGRYNKIKCSAGEDGRMENDAYRYRISWDEMESPRTFGPFQLFQAGRIHCRPNTVIPTHTQLNYVELTVAADGAGVVGTNGVAVPVARGDIYVSFAGDFHTIWSDAAHPLKFEYVTVQTADPALRGAMEELIATHHDATARVLRDDRLRALVSQIIWEANHPAAESDRAIEAAIMLLFIEMIRDFRANAPQNEEEHADGAKETCLRVMNYIDHHIYTIRNLRELCAVTHYSYNYLSNLFQRTTGDTLAHYYQNRRLETAALLLRSGRFSVSETAQVLGYSSIYAFSPAFKNKYGTSPGAYRRRAEAEAQPEPDATKKRPPHAEADANRTQTE